MRVIAAVLALLLSADVSRGEGVCPSGASSARALLAGDSWAQLMWDDNSHNDIFDKFGHADKRMISRSLGSDPGPGYNGPEYAISGSEARHWASSASYPWIANMVADIQANPGLDTVVLSVGGNDILAGKSEGGWYKDMDLDVPGSEAALFARITADTQTVISAAQGAAAPLEVLVSSYEYPNFNVNPLWCWIYACPKRRDLSRDPDGDLITDAELNAMMVSVEQLRVDSTNADPRQAFDHSIGLMHHYYGDSQSPPGALPHPGTEAPLYAPFPGGNPTRPTLRENFRTAGGIPADPIHLDFDGYQYKITNQTEAYFFPRFRGVPGATFRSQGQPNDGWTDGVDSGSGGIRVGDTGSRGLYGLVSFDTSPLPDGATIQGASLYLLRQSQNGTNPFGSGNLGSLRLDVRTGSFGAPEVEPSDATAPADASDAGCYHGSVSGDFYALRVDLTADALAAINLQGLTQIRLSFPGVDPGLDEVSFYGGDAALGPPRLRSRTVIVETLVADGTIQAVEKIVRAIEHRGLAELMGSPAPFLDVTYDLGPFAIFADGFESGGTGAWSATRP